ncbi:MAG: hypothetical protein P4L46_24985 [Fimbriimonas sp.]|nr:hypothetical protein [Fimbriimonas sp.]
MARKQSPGLLIGKWIILPILLALLGYFVIGPRIGKVKAKPETQESAQPSSTAMETPQSDPVGHPSTADQTESKPTPPDLDISVQKVSHKATSVVAADPETKPKHRHKKHVLAEDQPPTQDDGSQKVDEGGSAGATTAG